MTNNEQSKTNLDTKIIGAATALLAIDAIIVPFLTDGKTTLHEYLGLGPHIDYKSFTDNTSLMWEKGLWGVGMLYTVIREKYSNRNNSKEHKSTTNKPFKPTTYSKIDRYESTLF